MTFEKGSPLGEAMEEEKDISEENQLFITKWCSWMNIIFDLMNSLLQFQEENPEIKFGSSNVEKEYAEKDSWTFQNIKEIAKDFPERIQEVTFKLDQKMSEVNKISRLCMDKKFNNVESFKNDHDVKMSWFCFELCAVAGKYYNTLLAEISSIPISLFYDLNPYPRKFNKLRLELLYSKSIVLKLIK